MGGGEGAAQQPCLVIGLPQKTQFLLKMVIFLEQKLKKLKRYLNFDFAGLIYMRQVLRFQYLATNHREQGTNA